MVKLLLHPDPPILRQILRHSPTSQHIINFWQYNERTVGQSLTQKNFFWHFFTTNKITLLAQCTPHIVYLLINNAIVSLFLKNATRGCYFTERICEVEIVFQCTDKNVSDCIFGFMHVQRRFLKYFSNLSQIHWQCKRYLYLSEYNFILPNSQHGITLNKTNLFKKITIIQHLRYFIQRFTHKY